MIKELTAEYILAQAEKARKEQNARIRKVCRDAFATDSTVPYSVGVMLDAHVPVDTIRKVYRDKVSMMMET